jgi:multicomponent Na+:H+ antiporter subunit C
VTVLEAALVGILTAVGTYLVIHRTLTRVILGLAVLANAANLLVLTSGSTSGDAPIIGTGGQPADPVPQALVLTAIVIGLATIAFLLSVAYRSWTIDGADEVEDDIEDRRLGRIDADEAGSADPVPDDQLAAGEEGVEAR